MPDSEQVSKCDVVSVHLVGFNWELGEGQVSSAVVRYDAKRRVATTSSSRRYGS